MTIIDNPYLKFIKLEYINIENLCDHYKNLYVIGKKTDNDINQDIYKSHIDHDDFNEIKKHLILYKISIKLLKNINHSNKLLLLSSDTLQDINVLNYDLGESNLVLLIVNIRLDNLKLYLDQYEQKNNLKNIYKIIVLNQYFNNDIIKNSLLDLDDSNYWVKKYNCHPNITKYFEKRIFNISKTNEYYDYLNDIPYKDYIDYNKIFNNEFILSDTSLTKMDINLIFDNLNEKKRYLLFCYLLISKNYCHLALNNRYLLLLMKKTINKYIHLFRYLIGYSWIKFYFDECMKKENITKNDNFIFDINTASELPIFPFILEYPKLNPYMPILVRDTVLNSKKNIGGIIDIRSNKNLINNGICNLDEFKKRLNIFTTGNANNNLFQNIDFDKNKIAITGSIMTACLQKHHPLVNLFNNIINFDQKMNRYFNEYYSDSDIDIMISCCDIFEYMNIVHDIYSNIIRNINSFYGQIINKDNIQLECIKTANLYISEIDILEKICNNSKDKLNIIKKTLDLPDTVELFKDILEAELIKYTNNIKNDIIKYPEYNNFTNTKFKILITNKTAIEISYKYKIKSNYLNHNLEIFMVKNSEFFHTIQKFHLPCVRSYYDGLNVYLTPSCITAHLTYMNIDYKYFTSSSNPIDIINKYRMRGFGTWFNENEKIKFINYSEKNNYWNNFYQINSKIEDTINSIFGSLDFNNKLFQPRLINGDIYINGYNNNPYIDLNYEIPKIHSKLSSFDEFFNEINYRYNSNHVSIKFIENLQTINENGSIRPIEKWVIEAVYNIIKNNTIVNNTIFNTLMNPLLDTVPLNYNIQFNI